MGVETFKYTEEYQGIPMEITTIKLEQKTKQELDQFREYKDESYGMIVRKLLHIVRLAKKEPKLSQKTIEEIELARARIKAGDFYTLEEVEAQLGKQKAPR